MISKAPFMFVQWREEPCWCQGPVRGSSGLIPSTNSPQLPPSKSSLIEFLPTLQRKTFLSWDTWICALALLRNWRGRIGDWKGAFKRAVHVTFPLLGAKMGSSLLLLANTEEEELFSELHLGASKQKSLLLTLLLHIF